MVDSPDAKEFVDFIKDAGTFKLFVSPINIEEFKLASENRRVELVRFLNELREHLVLVKHPDLLMIHEFKAAFGGKIFDGNNIIEEDSKKIKEYNAFLDDPISNIDEEENGRVKHKKLLNRYIQILTRKEPIGSYSFSEVQRARAEAHSLSTQELQQKIEALGTINFINSPFTEYDIIAGLRSTLIQLLAKFRPQISYFFDKEKGPDMIKLFWPGKERDSRLAAKIMNIDFREMCPGSWIRYNVSFGQIMHRIEPGNWADGAHSFYLAYTGHFWTSDETLYSLMKSIHVSESTYCGSVCYLEHFLKKKT